MMRRHQHLLAAGLLLLVCHLAGATTGAEKHKTLVLIANEAARQNYSKYLASLHALSGELDVRLGSDSKLQLRHWDDWLYDTVVILQPGATELGGAIDFALLVEFVDAGGNLLLALDSSVSDQLRELSAELGVDVEPAGTAVIDHFSHASIDAAHTTVLASNFANSKAVFGGRAPTPVVYEGIGLSVAPDSVLTFPVLWASATAYSAMPRAPLRDNPTLAGQELRLAVLSQPRSGGRVAVIGSTAALGDAAFVATVPSGSGSVTAGNEEFASAVTRWLLHQRGVLRFGEFVHHHPGAIEEPDTYRIKDWTEFSVEVRELVDGEWRPYRADDVQLEFVMLDPYVRVNLTHDNQGTFSTKFQVPDVYGVFKFVIEYAKDGYSHVLRSKQIAVRPFKHDEFDRFLLPAYPYYTAAVTTMAAFAVLSLVFLYS